MITKGSLCYGSRVVGECSIWLGASRRESADQRAVKEAVKAAPAAAKKAGGQQVKQEAGSAAATAKAAKALRKSSAELYPKAKQEGNLVVYSVWDVEHLRVITEAFMKRYPGIKATLLARQESRRSSPAL